MINRTRIFLTYQSNITINMGSTIYNILYAKRYWFWNELESYKTTPFDNISTPYFCLEFTGDVV